MARLWVRMSALFGRKWDTYAGEAGGGVFDEWCETLGSVPVDRIKRGLDVLQEEMPEWPPSLMDFMRMCSGKRRGDEGRVQTYSDRNFTEERIAAAKQGHLERKKQRLTPEQVMQRLANIGGESQRESYERLGLHKRWGSLPPPGEWSREIRMAEEMDQKSDRNKRT